MLFVMCALRCSLVAAVYHRGRQWKISQFLPTLFTDSERVEVQDLQTLTKRVKVTVCAFWKCKGRVCPSASVTDSSLGNS